MFNRECGTYLVDGESDGGLVVLDRGEDTRLRRRNRGVAGNNDTKDIAEHSNTERKWADIEKKKVGSLVGSLVGKDGTLDGSSVSNRLIGVNRLVEGTAIEELGNEGLDLGDTSGSTDKDDVVDLGGRDLRVLQNTLNGLNGALESSRVDLLETGTGDVGREVDTVVQRVDLDGGLGDGRKSTLSTLTGRAKTTEGTGVVRDVGLVLALELSLEVLKEGVVEVLTTEVGVTSGGLDGEDTTGDGKERNIEGTTSEVEDEDVLLLLGLRVKAVSDGSGGGLVDDTENVEASNGTGVLGGKTLGVVEVGGDAGALARWKSRNVEV